MLKTKYCWNYVSHKLIGELGVGGWGFEGDKMRGGDIYGSFCCRSCLAFLSAIELTFRDTELDASSRNLKWLYRFW